MKRKLTPPQRANRLWRKYDHMWGMDGQPMPQVTFGKQKVPGAYANTTLTDGQPATIEVGRKASKWGTSRDPEKRMNFNAVLGHELDHAVRKSTDERAADAMAARINNQASKSQAQRLKRKRSARPASIHSGTRRRPMKARDLR